ncbi:hypothetical protein KFK09_018203 [Dendrobium nobile]|uniref:Uncharacterized protein n=1 Tax=Dendrobium nobile TaxID=94219 RepID=A0A8T3B0M0_DENNO|nr:hypothetical protein KFK09_018203 [Dendrobium nobile]
MSPRIASVVTEKKFRFRFRKGREKIVLWSESFELCWQALHSEALIGRVVPTAFGSRETILLETYLCVFFAIQGRISLGIYIKDQTVASFHQTVTAFRSVHEEDRGRCRKGTSREEIESEEEVESSFPATLTTRARICDARIGPGMRRGGFVAIIGLRRARSLTSRAGPKGGGGLQSTSALKLRKAKEEIVTASKVAYRFLASKASISQASPDPPSDSNREGTNPKLQGSWLKNLAIFGAKPSGSSSDVSETSDETHPFESRLSSERFQQ